MYVLLLADYTEDHYIMSPLVTLLIPPSWCSNRYDVFVDEHAPGTRIIPPSSGWIDPSFSRCIPTQYTTMHPTFSAGMRRIGMEIVRSTFQVLTGEPVWT